MRTLKVSQPQLFDILRRVFDGPKRFHSTIANSPGASGAYLAPPWRLFFMGANLFVSVYWVVFNNVPMKKLIWAVFNFTVCMATSLILAMTRGICINSIISWSVLIIKEQTWYQNVAKTLVFHLHIIKC